MKPLIVFSDVTIDGFMAGPDNDLDFMVDDPQLEDELTGMLMSVADTIVVGRKAFPDMATLINPSNLRNHSFAPLLKKAGLPQITFHDLRHTTASLLFSKNVHPKFVQELLGHASVAFTLDTYSHMLPGMGGEAADAMGDALG
jgi:hypothetical protein